MIDYFIENKAIVNKYDRFMEKVENIVVNQAFDGNFIPVKSKQIFDKSMDKLEKMLENPICRYHTIIIRNLKSKRYH